MPLLVPINELQVGMMLGRPVRHGGRVLLNAGRALGEQDINSLRSRFPGLTVTVSDPILDGAVEFEDIDHEMHLAESVSQAVAEAILELQRHCLVQGGLPSRNLHAAQSAILDALRQLEENPKLVNGLTQPCVGTDYLTQHTGNVFYLATLLGRAMRSYVSQERGRGINAWGVDRRHLLDLTPLALAAAYMDLGMLPMRELYASDGPLTATDREKVCNHAVAGAAMLPESASVLVRAVIKTHHENYDGSGYPQGTPGKRLHVFTRILRIADAYDAATSRHVYKQAKSPARVLWEMTVGPYSRFYDPVLIDVFARLIQPFPIGSKLRLTDGRYAVVVRYNRNNSYAPQVVIAFDRDNKPLSADQLVGPFGLSERPDMRIVSYGNEDLSYIYRGSFGQSAPVVPGEFTSLYEAMYP